MEKKEGMMKHPGKMILFFPVLSSFLISFVSRNKMEPKKTKKKKKKKRNKEEKDKNTIKETRPLRCLVGETCKTIPNFDIFFNSTTSNW